ncbi:hypothetical protein [Massilia suwonensis]|uniref:DUF3784 domain-containing protein n=1 Tax=Massilia suwonensis TaxID=648895 RepID=A0ABW0MQJ8_9BURK
MSEVFLVIALILFGLVILLTTAADRRLLNFVDYDTAPSTARINRYAAARLLLPVCVNAGCAWAAARHPELTVPLLFLTPLSILGTVIWIGAGVQRLQATSS